MKKIIFLATLCSLLLFSCNNSVYDDLVTREEFENVRSKLLKGLEKVEAEKGSPLYLQFTQNGIKKIDTASSNDWHISSSDVSWRISSNSGTTATAKGGVIAFKDVPFDNIRKIKESSGSVTVSDNELQPLTPMNTTWEVDKKWTYSEGEMDAMDGLSLNYYLTDRLTGNGKEESGTFLFSFQMAGMKYFGGEDCVFIVKDGSGGNYIKLQGVEITTDNPGSMSFTKRVYYFRYEVADADGEFIRKE